MQNILLALLFLTLGCSSATQRADAVVEPNSPFTLSTGDKVFIRGAGLTLRFVRVAEDSRCPEDVQCVHEGNAQVEFHLAKTGYRDLYVLNTNSRAGPTTINLNGHVLRLVELRPQPREKGGSYRDGYSAVFIVEESSNY